MAGKANWIISLISGLSCSLFGFILLQDVQSISAADFYAITENAADSINIIIDVRTPKEYSQSHLPGAILMDYYDPDFKIKITTLSSKKPCFVYCKTGIRSKYATQLLLSAGFSEVYNIEGGWIALQKAKP